MASNSIQSPALTPLLDVKFTTPEYESIMDTWRSIPGLDTPSSSSCIATDLPTTTKAPQNAETSMSTTTHEFLSKFGKALQDKAKGKKSKCVA